MFEIALVSRPKLNLLGTHYGVDLGNGSVLDPQQDGIRIVSQQDFAKGHPVKIECKRKTSPMEWLEIFSIAKTFKYDLVDNNCEHTSRGIVEKKKESRQVQYWFFGGICLVLLYVIFKK